MATVQGMCRNCGALIIFDNRDEQCECVFCNCVFPAEQALELMENPEGHVFPNEKIEPSGNASHHYQTRVFSDESIEKAIKREQLSKAASSSESAVTVKNEYEVSPNDVKAPKNLAIGLTAGIIVSVALIVGIALPLKNSRDNLYAGMTNKIFEVYSNVITVNASRDENGNSRGYCFSGQTAQNLKIITSDEVSEETARQLFENYCQMRAQLRGRGTSGDIYSGVEVKIYCSGGVYTVKQVKGTITATFSDDASQIQQTEADS